MVYNLEILSFDQRVEICSWVRSAIVNHLTLMTINSFLGNRLKTNKNSFFFFFFSFQVSLLNDHRSMAFQFFGWCNRVIVSAVELTMLELRARTYAEQVNTYFECFALRKINYQVLGIDSVAVKRVLSPESGHFSVSFELFTSPMFSLRSARMEYESLRQWQRSSFTPRI